MRPYIALVPLIFCAWTPAHAGDEQPPKAYADMVECRSISDGSARLACFDKASGELENARTSKSVVILDRADVSKARRSLFGFTLPDLPFFDGDDSDEEEVSEIATSFETVREIGFGKWQFTVPEGGTWQSTEALSTTPKPGQAILIKKGVAGGYMLKIGKGPLRRVKRMN